MSKQPNSYEPTGRYIEPANSINWWKWIIGFDGRINRSGLWVRFLLSWISWLVGIVLLRALTPEPSTDTFNFLVGLVFGLHFLVGTPMFICGLVRRFHDRGKSGWSVLLLLIPIWNLGVLFALFFLEGDLTSNEFGKPPAGLRVG